MASKCPECGAGLKLSTGDNGEPTSVYCSKMKMEKQGEEFVNIGSCDFRILFKQKLMNLTLSKEDMKRLLAGKDIVNPRGDRLSLDLTNKEFFTKYTKKEDEDF